MIYIFLYTSYFWLSILEVVSRNRLFFRSASIILSLFLLFIMAFRGRVGRDYFEYIRLYYEGGGFSFLGFPDVDPLGLYFEPLFVLLNKVLFSLNSPLPFVFFIYFLISFVFISSSIKKYSPYFFVSFLLFLSQDFLLKELIQIRFGIASALFLYSLQYLTNKNYLFYCFLILCASFIHISALAGFVFLIFWHFRSFFYKYFFSFFIISIFLSFTPFTDFFHYISLLNSRLDNFLLNERYNIPSLFSYLTLLKQSIWLFIFYKFRFSLRSFRYFDVLFASYLFSSIFLFIFFDLSALSARIAAYYSITEFVLIPMLIYIQKSLINKFLLVVLISLYAISIAWFNIFVRHVVRDFYLVF